MENHAAPVPDETPGLNTGPRCSVFIATSLDGFIARLDGSIDWLTEANTRVPPGEDCGYQRFFSCVDALVMGRSTLEQALAFPEWPYGNTPVVALSRQWKALPAGAPATVSLSAETPVALVQRLSQQGLRHLYIDGGLTVQGFLAAGLVDEITVTTIPVLLGAGLPLFGPLPADLHLDLMASQSYPFGFVQNTYRVRHAMAQSNGT